MTDGDVDVVLPVAGLGDGEQRRDRPALHDLEAVVDQAPLDVLRAPEARRRAAELIDSLGLAEVADRTVSTLSGGRFELKEATLYTSFKRLEETGCITSYWGGSGPGARRRYYSITQTGRETCARLLQEWRETREIMDNLLHVEEEA